MFGRELAKEFEKKEEERKANPGTDFFRSYYSGYGLQEMECEDGITRNEFVYSGILYRYCGSHRKRVVLKVLHCFLAALAVGCLILIGMQQAGSVNSSKIFAAPFFASAVLSVLRVFAAAMYSLSGDLMKEWDHTRAIKRFKLFCLLSSISGAVGIIICIVLAVSNGSYTAETIYSILGYSGIFAGAAASLWVERRQIYAQVLANDISRKFTAFC